MENVKPRLGWIRGTAASVLTLLYLAILIPNLWSLTQFVIYVGILLIPLACIHFGAGSVRWLEIIGWVLLVGLFILAL